MTSTTLDTLIYGRRSIRKYRPEPPPEEWITSMILTAMRAPSPSNSQPVRFIRLRSPEVRNLLHQAMVEGRERLMRTVTETDAPKRLRNWVSYYFRYSEFMFDAPVLFAVGTTLTFVNLSERLFQAGVKRKGHRKHTDLDISVGLALTGYLLKGEELGLGSCILTAPLIFLDEPEKIISVKGIEIKCFIASGYPDEEPPQITRRDIKKILKEV